MPQTLLSRGPASGAALAVLLLATACRRQQEAPQVATFDPPVAHVGGETLHLSDVRRAAAAQDPGAASHPLDTASPLYRVALQEVVDQRLLALEAQRRKLEKDPAVRRRLAAARDRVLADAALDREITGGLSEPALRALYDEQSRQSQPAEEVDVVQIVSPTQADAQAVRAQIAAGANVGELAQRRSIDPATRFAHGELGWVVPASVPAPYGAALAAAKPGEVIGPLSTPQGFVVAEVRTRRRQPPLPFEAVRPQLVRVLTYARLQTLLGRLRQGGDVVILPPPAVKAAKP